MTTEQPTTKKQTPAKKANRRSPTLLVIWTVLVVLGLTLIHWQMFFLNEQFNMNPGIPGLATIVLVPVTFVGWGIWGLFVAKLRLVGLLILAIPIGFFTLYYPNFLGDANIAGWTPRFWKRQVDYVSVSRSENSQVDLTTTSIVDYPQFLGAQRNGVVAGIELDADWNTNPPELLWKQPIGEGWSGFAAVNGYAVTQEQRESEECVTCYEIETGQLKWIYAAPRRHEDTMAMGKAGPRATPTIDEGRVYATGGTGVLDCLDGSNGQLIWTVDVPALVGIEQISHTNSRGLGYTMEDSALEWGRSCSPLIYKDKVIVPAGGPNDDTAQSTTTLIAFDKKTGEEIWRGGSRMVAYGSPSIENVLGQDQILLIAESDAVGHDPETGAELWSHDRPGNSGADANCSQVTRVSESKLLLCKGYNAGGELIELTNVDGKIDTATLFKDTRILKTKLTSPVIFNGHAYALSDGYLECTEIEGFRRKWKKRGRFGNGQLLLVGDKLVVHTESGTLLLVAADPAEYRELGSMKTIEGICWNTLCLYGDKLLVRSELEAACIQLPTKSNSNTTN